MSEPPRGNTGTRPLYGGERGPSAGARGRDRGVAGQSRHRSPPPASTPRRGSPQRGSRRPGSRRWGSLPGRTGILIVIGGAVLGGLVTAATRSTPGSALGIFVIGATAAAVFAVRPRAVHLVIPVPALSYMAAATAAGLVEINGHAAGTFTTTLAVSAAQWMASGFVSMTAATVLAIAATAARWPFRRPAPRDTGYPPPTARAGRPQHRPRRDADGPAAAGSGPVPHPRRGA